ncbi:MAG: hypothetical protein WCJ35_05560 [Planctomycetota bacterium]
MQFRRGTAVNLVLAAYCWLGVWIILPTAAGQSQGTVASFLADASPTAPTSSANSAPAPPPVNSGKVDDLLNMDLDQLSKVRVSTARQATNVNAPSSQVNSGNINSIEATTTGEMAREAPSVSTRRTSAVNLDPRVRGYRMNEHLRLNMALENLFNRSYVEPGSLAIINQQGVPAFVREPGFTALLGMEARF